jgi:hypothetical protein
MKPSSKSLIAMRIKTAPSIRKSGTSERFRTSRDKH